MRLFTSTLFGILFFGLVSVSTHAQISILNSDMPSAGDTFRLSSALGGGGGGGGQVEYLLTQTGANQIWDYTFLTSKSQSVDTFYSPLETPLSYNFVFTNLILYPDNFADLAQRSTTIPTPPGGGGGGGGFFTISDAYDFIQSFSDQYAIVGNAFKLNDVPSANPFEGKDVLYEFPLEFQDNFSSASSYEVQVPSFVEFYHRQVRTNEVDGWGKLYTPYGEWVSVLRVKSTIVANDSAIFQQGPFPFPISFPSTTVEYKWLAKNIGIPVLQIITRESSGFGGGGGQTSVTSVEYIDSINPGTYQIDDTGVLELEKNGFVVYPNPAKDRITVLSKHVSNAAIVVRDLQGRIILSQPAKGIETTLDLGSITTGLYTLELNGKVVKWAKVE